MAMLRHVSTLRSIKPVHGFPSSFLVEHTRNFSRKSLISKTTAFATTRATPRRCLPRNHLAFQIHGRNSSSSRAYNAYRGTQRVIWTIIGVNTAVFGLWSYGVSQRDPATLRLLSDHAILSWRNIHAGRYHTLISSTFSHYNTPHFFFNMFGLWTFGSIIGRAGVGPLPTLGLLMGSAVCGSVAWLYEHRQSDRAARHIQRIGAGEAMSRASALGASGMVMGAVMTATCLAPTAPMALMGIIPLPLYVATAAFVAADLYYLDKSSRIGHSAHLGGAVFGAVFYALYLRRFGGVIRLLSRR